MKKFAKIILSTLFLTLVMNVFSQNVKKNIISSSNEKMVVSIENQDFSLEKVNTPNGIESIVKADGCYTHLRKGFPDLPQTVVPLLIDNKADYEVKIVDSDYYDVPNVKIAPSKGNISRTQNIDEVPYTYNDVYQQDAFWPETMVSLEKPYIIRNFRGQNLYLTPFAYNPQTQTLRVFTKVKVEVVKTSKQGVNTLENTSAIHLDKETKAALQRRFINFDQMTSKYTFIIDEGETLIITKNEFADAMKDYVKWKNISGRPTTLVTTAETGSTPSAIKQYMQQYYAAHPNLKYLLIVGDHEHVPTYTYYQGGEECGSDNYYAKLVGNDAYVDIFVGRFSVSSVEDVNTMVEKSIYYERDLGTNSLSTEWLKNGLGISANEGAGSGHHGEADYQHINFVRDSLLHYTYSTVHQQYKGIGAGTTPAKISNDINNGVSIINYCNHGSEDSWTVAYYDNTCVANLTNDYMLPAIISVACLNGKIDYYKPCFAEVWMRSRNKTTNNPVGAIGGMFSYVPQPWVEPQEGQDEMINILTEWRGDFNHTLSGYMLNGNEIILDVYPSDNGYTHDTWLLFGDPSLIMRTDVPTSFAQVAPKEILVGESSMNINVNAKALVTLTDSKQNVIFSQYVEPGDNTVTFEPIADIDTMTLVTIGFNKITEIHQIVSVPAEGPYLSLESLLVENPKGQLEYDETVTLGIKIKNIGVENVKNVKVKLLSDNENVEILQGETTVDAVAVGEEKDLTAVFTVKVGNEIKDQNEILFNIEMKTADEAYLWTSKRSLSVNSPFLALVDYALQKDLKIGEDNSLDVSIINRGHAKAKNVVVKLTSLYDPLTFDPTQVDMSELEAETTGKFTYSVMLRNDESLVPGLVIPVKMEVENGFYGFVDTLYLSYGMIIDDFETGDFSAMEWINVSAKPWTIVSNQYHSANHSAKSGKITDNQSTTLMIKQEFLNDNEISFYFKVSCENGYDYFIFTVDNVEIERFTGEMDWTYFVYPVKKGDHTFKWTYSKDYMMSDGQDCAWIDDVKMPGAKSPEAIITIDYDKPQLLVYPNPTSDYITVGDVENAESYEIFDLRGNCVMRDVVTSEKNVINLQKLSRGVYFIMIGESYQKIIKK